MERYWFQLASRILNKWDFFAYKVYPLVVIMEGTLSMAEIVVFDFGRVAFVPEQ